MTAVDFSILDAFADRRTASPTMRLRIGVHLQDGGRVDAMALQARVLIAPGAPERELQWTQTAVLLEGFSGETAFDLPVPCTYDLRVASSRFLASLDGAPIPVRVVLNGTAFRGAKAEPLEGGLECRMLVSDQTWRETMDACFPDQAWLRVDRATFDALRHYAVDHELFGSSEVIGDLLKRARVEERT